MDIKKTANLLINFAVKRLAEIFGFLKSPLIQASSINLSDIDNLFTI